MSNTTETQNLTQAVDNMVARVATFEAELASYEEAALDGQEDSNARLTWAYNYYDALCASLSDLRIQRDAGLRAARERVLKLKALAASTTFAAEAETATLRAREIIEARGLRSVRA